VRGKIKIPILLALLIGWAVTLAAKSVAIACAVCVTGGGNDSSANAYNWSLLFLMAMPYVVAGSVLGWLVHAYRRAAAKREVDEASESAGHLAWNQRRVEDE
jgi:hypothetical protein